MKNQTKFCKISMYSIFLALFAVACEGLHLGSDTQPMEQTPRAGAPIQVNYSISIQGNEVTITNKTENADFFEWDFGDGFTFRGKNPEPHVYDDFGSYSLRLLVRQGSHEERRSNTINIQWQPRNRFPGNNRVGGLHVEYDGLHYMGFGQSRDEINRNWWQYNSVSDSWKELPASSFPGAETIFRYKQKIYAVRPSPGRNKLEYVIFDLQNESWSSRHEIDLEMEIDVFFRLHRNSFVYEGHAYIISQHLVEEQTEVLVWKFNPETQAFIIENRWQPPMRIIDCTDGYFTEGKLYLIGSQMTFVYRPGMPDWSVGTGFRPQIADRFGFRISPVSDNALVVVGGGDRPPLIRFPFSLREPFSAFVGEFLIPNYKSQETHSAAPFPVLKPVLLAIPEGAILVGGNNNVSYDHQVWEYRSF